VDISEKFPLADTFFVVKQHKSDQGHLYYWSF